MVNIEEKLISLTNQSSEIILDNSKCPWRQDYLSREAILISHWKESGLFVETDLNDINCYWLKFEPAPVIYHMVLAVLFLVIFFVGSVSNGFVISIISTSRHMWTPVNIIIVNLAFSDFLMLSCLLLFVYNSMVQGPAIGYQGCVVYGFVSGIAGCVSIMSLAAIAIDRYFVITWPDRGGDQPQKKSLIRSYLTIIIIWIYSGIIASMPLFGVGKYVPEGYLTSCSFDYLSDDWPTRIFILVFFIMAWIVPISIIITSYFAVLRYVTQNPIILRQEEAIEVAHGSVGHQKQSHNRRECRKLKKIVQYEVRIAKTSALLVVLWLIAWTPYAIVSLLGISGYHSLLTPGLAMLPALFAKSSACINPFVYSLNHPKIRKEMGRRFLCCSCRSASANSGPSTGGNTTSHSRTRQSQRRESPILHFRSRLASNQQKTESSYDLKEIYNYLHQSSQMLDQLHSGLVNGPTCSIDLHDFQSSSSKPRPAGTRRVRLSQSETTCCADVHHLPFQSRRSNGTFQSESSNGRQRNDYLREKSIPECLTTVV